MNTLTIYTLNCNDSDFRVDGLPRSLLQYQNKQQQQNGESNLEKEQQQQQIHRAEICMK